MNIVMKLTNWLLLITLVIVFQTCSDDDNSPSSRKIRYEITGNFTGKLFIVYNDNVNGNKQVNNATIPWTQEEEYTSNVSAIGIGGNSSVVGSPGQVVNVKIYEGNKVLESGSATAGSLGEVSLPGLAHSF